MQQLRGVAPQADLGVVRPVHPVAVALPRADPGQEAVPDVAVHLGHVQPLLFAALVEQAQLDALGHLGEQREVGANAVVAGPKGVRLARPHFGIHTVHLPHVPELAHRAPRCLLQSHPGS